MADVNEMFSKVTEEQSFFNASEKKEFTPFAEGEYLTHIIEADSDLKDVLNGKYKARLYSFVVQVAEENKDEDFEYEDINGKLKPTKGSEYIGKKFRGKVWRFLEPQKGDTFESNAGGNKAYLWFCQNIGIGCPTESKTIDGKKVEVQLLPKLSADDMLGQPVVAFVAKGKPFKDAKGQTRQYWECKFCKKWEDGKRKKITAGGKDEIPF